MEQEEQFIPIDDQLNKFNTLLKNNNRLFFSAKFGDGKTTFLNEFKKQKQNEFQIITLFPINYQIVNNEDIFELIKRDILLQLLMLEDIVVGNNDIKFIKQLSGYFKENSIDIAEDLLVSATSIFSNVPFFPDMKEPLERLFKNINKFKTHTKEADEKHNQKKQTKKFLTNTNVFIYEFDAISQLIYMLIKQYKEKKGKDIVLIIEDLDRIDPKHLFRLLNIFSAHFDRINKVSNEEKSNLTDNKFGFDKIVFVCDYDNIKSIFHHFYGKNTDFKGYISKFSSAQPFRYSLKELYIHYICSIMPKEISKLEILSRLLSIIIVDQLDVVNGTEKLKNSLRTIKDNIINYKPSIIEKEITNKNIPNLKVNSINNFTIFIDILHRFNVDLADFKNVIDSYLKDVMNSNYLKKDFLNLVGESWKLSDFILIKNNTVIKFTDKLDGMIYSPLSNNEFNEINYSYYKEMMQGIDSVVERINESKIFTYDIIIKW